MAHKPIASYLRTHRKRSGLTQRELASILGYASEGQVSRHERAMSIPSIRIAFGYEAVFRVPVSDLFPGMYHAAAEEVEKRLAEREAILQEKSAKDRDANVTARKLEWMWSRRNGIEL